MVVNEYPIGELEEKTGIPRRTIYFYVQQGVLPPPSGAGLAARYQQSHLLRLQVIPRLRAIGWRLDEIRAFFQSATDAEIRAIVDGEQVVAADSTISPRRPVAPPAPSPARPTLLARYALAPGVDLYVSQDLPPRLARAVERLLDAAATIFVRSDVDPSGTDRPPEGSTDHPTSAVSPESEA